MENDLGSEWLRVKVSSSTLYLCGRLGLCVLPLLIVLHVVRKSPATQQQLDGVQVAIITRPVESCSALDTHRYRNKQ